MNKEEKENWEFVYSKMNQEEFHYCFLHYSNFEEINDNTFHTLRQQYIMVAKELEEYINKKYEESLEEE